jgi:hypothetical protein
VDNHFVWTFCKLQACPQMWTNFHTKCPQMPQMTVIAKFPLERVSRIEFGDMIADIFWHFLRSQMTLRFV